MAVLELSAGMEERARSLHRRALIFDACFSTPGFFKEEEREIQAFVDGGIGGGLATVAEEEHNFAKAVDSINKHVRLFRRHPDFTNLNFNCFDGCTSSLAGLIRPVCSRLEGGKHWGLAI